MEEEKAKFVPVSISPLHVYGLNINVLGTIQFNYNNEIIYPVEGALTFHDRKQHKQRFLRFPEYTVPKVISISTNRKLLAVVELVTPPDGSSTYNYISIYDTTTLKKRRQFDPPEYASKKEIKLVVFSHDGRSMLVITKPPDEIFFMMFYDKNETTYSVEIEQARGYVSCLAGNPQDFNMTAVCGNGILKFYSKTETGLTQPTTLKSGFNVTSLAWLQLEFLMLGTSRGRIVVIENCEIKLQVPGMDVDEIDLTKEDVEGGGEAVTKAPVACMIYSGKYFIYSILNAVYVFERPARFRLQRKIIVKLQQAIYSENLCYITNMAYNPTDELIIVTALHAQIYEVSLKNVELEEFTIYLKFKPFSVSLHNDEIVGLSVCSWRTIVMTASKDLTIRIWNYDSNIIEFVKKFAVDITAVELDATGQFAAIGFSDQLRIMQIFMDDLHIMKTYNFPKCSQVKYSFFGHLMAAAYDNKVAIASVYNLNIIRTLRGHNGNVLSLAWSRDDKYVISGGAEGAIYQWQVDTGARVQEIVQKGMEYRQLKCTSEPMTIFAVTASGLLRQISKSEIIREFSTPNKSPCLSLALARSDLIMFIPTMDGQLYNVQLPFLDTGGGTFTPNRFFTSAVTKVAFTYDDTLLITGSKSGTVAIWAIQNIENKVIPLDQDLLRGQEILIPRDALQDTIEQISNLELRIQQQAAEFQYQESQNEMFESQQLADIHKGYCTALETMKARNNELEKKNTDELNAITFEINDLKNEQKRQMYVLSEHFTERMVMEYQKLQAFTKSSNEIKDRYEAKLRKAASLLQDSVEALEVDFERQLEERDALARELMQEIQDEKYEFNEYCRQVACEFDSKITDNVIKYENLMKNDQDAEVLWRGKAGVLKKKTATLTAEIERLVEEVEQLKEEQSKANRVIAKLQREVEDIKKDITDREFAISIKEKYIQENLHRNQVLEKYKQVLTHRITELKMQIEPLECQINDKRKQMTDLENQLGALNKDNLDLEIIQKKMVDKYLKNLSQLQTRRKQARRLRAKIHNIYNHIYHTANEMDPKKIYAGVQKMYHIFATDQLLRKHIISEHQVHIEFNRQRNYIEQHISSCKKKLLDKGQAKIAEDMVKRNLSIIETIDFLRKENVTLKRTVDTAMATLRVPTKGMGLPQMRLTATFEEIEKHKELMSVQKRELTAQIEQTKNQIADFTSELVELEQLLATKAPTETATE